MPSSKFSACLFSLCFVFNVVPALAASSNYAKFISIDAPDYMVSGKQYSIGIEYKNAGSTVWDSSKRYRLVWVDPGQKKIWGAVKTGTLFETPVAPGEIVKIGFDLTAPRSIRSAQLSWQLQGPNGERFGDAAETRPIQIERSDKQARIVMQRVPGEVVAGQSFNADFRVENIGNTTWNRDGGYQLVALNRGVWNISRIELGEGVHIAPGDIASFKANFTAPETAGVYAFQWQMQHNNHFFGDVSAPVNVVVSGNINTLYDSEFVYQKVAQTMLLGETHEVVVQFKNTSKLTWHAADISLVTPDSQDLVWAVDSVAMDSVATIAPGEFAIFRFNIQAPLDAGQYPFQWQLSHRRVGLFGVPSEQLLIDVK